LLTKLIQITELYPKDYIMEEVKVPYCIVVKTVNNIIIKHFD